MGDWIIAIVLNILAAVFWYRAGVRDEREAQKRREAEKARELLSKDEEVQP